MPSTLTPPSTRITRDDIVRLGRTGSSWEYVPLALAALRVMPADAEVRFLLAAAYAKLALRTCALEQLDRLAPETHSDPAVAALRDSVRAMPEDRVPIDELQRTLTNNLDALARQAGPPLKLHHHLESWRARAMERVRTRYSWDAVTDAYEKLLTDLSGKTSLVVTKKA